MWASYVIFGVLMTNFSAIFEQFLSGTLIEHPEMLNANRDAIIKQVLSNIGLKGKDNLSAEEERRFVEELNGVVYLNSQLPCLIGDREHTDALENPKAPAHATQSIDVTNAQNIFRHLTRGTALTANAGEHYSHSFLAHDDIINNFLKQRNPQLMRVFRQQLQIVLDNAWSKLQDKSLTGDDAKQYEIFQSNVMASYPFWDPEENEQVRVPQKINDVWQLVTYQFKRFDISPKSGPLSWVLEDQDRMYAYAMIPTEKHPDALSHLLLMGTTYPAGQGSALAALYNFYPQHSVGEAHDMSEVDQWLKAQSNKNVKIVGHSKGATMAMITAARHPTKILQVDSLNPTGLSEATLARLTPSWNELPMANRPFINVYAQLGDPAFPLEKGFLEGTNIYRIIPNTHVPSMNVAGPLSLSIPEALRKAYEAHIHIFAGRSSALLLKVNMEQENNSLRRELFDDIKHVLNWICFPLEYTELLVKLMARKAGKFLFVDHQILLLVGLVGAVILGTIIFNAAIIPFMMLSLESILVKLGIGLSVGLIKGIAVSLTSISPILAYLSMELLYKVSELAAKTTFIVGMLAAHISAIVLGSLLFALKQGVNLIFGASDGATDANNNQELPSSRSQNTSSFFKDAPVRNELGQAEDLIASASSI